MLEGEASLGVLHSANLYNKVSTSKLDIVAIVRKAIYITYYLRRGLILKM